MVLAGEYNGWVWRERSPWPLRIVSVGSAILIVSVGFWLARPHDREIAQHSGAPERTFAMAVGFVMPQPKTEQALSETVAERPEELKEVVNETTAIPQERVNQAFTEKSVMTTQEPEVVIQPEPQRQHPIEETPQVEKTDLPQKTEGESHSDTSNKQKTQEADANESVAASVNHQNQLGVHNDIVLKPRFREQPVPPVYPRIARKRGQEGVVWLDIWLDEKGEQVKLEVSNSSGVSQLDKAATRAVKQWLFEPRYIAGLASPSRVRIPIEFSLN